MDLPFLDPAQGAQSLLGPQGLGTSIVVGTRFGSFTISPLGGGATPGDASGAPAAPSWIISVFQWLQVTIGVTTQAGSIGPFPVGQ